MGAEEGCFGIVSLEVSMVTDCCGQPTRLGPLSVLSPGETMGFEDAERGALLAEHC